MLPLNNPERNGKPKACATGALPKVISNALTSALCPAEQHQNAKLIGASVAFVEFDTVPKITQTARLMLAKKQLADSRAFLVVGSVSDRPCSRGLR
jgi:hypothetical protein